jgi:hypothetical protein
MPASPNVHSPCRKNIMVSCLCLVAQLVRHFYAAGNCIHTSKLIFSCFLIVVAILLPVLHKIEQPKTGGTTVQEYLRRLPYIDRATTREASNRKCTKHFELVFFNSAPAKGEFKSCCLCTMRSGVATHCRDNATIVVFRWQPGAPERQGVAPL